MNYGGPVADLMGNAPCRSFSCFHPFYTKTPAESISFKVNHRTSLGHLRTSLGHPRDSTQFKWTPYVFFGCRGFNYFHPYFTTTCNGAGDLVISHPFFY